MLGFGNNNPPKLAKGHIWHNESADVGHPPIARPRLSKVSEDDTDEDDRERDSREATTSPDEFDEKCPIIGYSQGKKGEDWSEIPTCPLAESNNYRPSWSNNMMKLLHSEDRERAIGFWMNLKKTVKGPNYPYVTLQDNIGTNEVLTKPQTPSPNDTQESSPEESPNTDKCLHLLIPEKHNVQRQTPPSSTTVNRGSKILIKHKRESRQKCSGSSNATSSKKSQRSPTPRSKSPRPPFTPPYSPCASQRELRPLSPSQYHVRHSRAGAQSKSRGNPQRSRLSRRASLIRFDSSRFTPQTLRPVTRATPSTPRRRPSQHFLRSQESPRSFMHHSQSQSYCQNYRRPTSLTRPRSPGGNRNSTLRSLTSVTTGMSKSSLCRIPKKNMSGGKKKKFSNTKTAYKRKKSLSSQDSRVSPLPAYPPIRNTGQQTDLHLSSISTQTVMKCTVHTNEATDTDKIQPILMSRTAQTLPMTPSELKPRLEGEELPLDSEKSPIESQSSISGVTKTTRKPIAVSSSKLTRTSLDMSTVAQESKKFSSHKTAVSTLSLFARGSKAESRTNLSARKCNLTQAGKTSQNLLLKWEGQKSEAVRRKPEKQDSQVGKKCIEQLKGSGTACNIFGSPVKAGAKKIGIPPTKIKPTPTKDVPSTSSFTSSPDDIKAIVENFTKRHENSLSTNQENPTWIDADSELCSKLAPIFRRYVNKGKATDPRELVKKSKGMQMPIKDKILGQSNITRSLVKYGTHFQPPAHMLKNKSFSSVEVSAMFNRKRISKPMAPKEIAASSRTGQTRDAVVKKNLNMLIEACQNLLSEAMKETEKKDPSEKIKQKKAGPTTRETVAWILQTLKNTYGNIDEAPKATTATSNEQECQTSCNKILTPTIDRRSLSRLPSNDQSETAGTSQISWPDLTFSFNSADKSSGATKTPEEKSPVSSTREHFCPMPRKEFAPSSLSMGDSSENDLVHLNCGMFKVALRQVSGTSSVSRLETVKEESRSSYTIDEILKQSPEEVVNTAVHSLPDVAGNVVLVTPMTIPAHQANVNPVTKVSIWSKPTSTNGPYADVLEDPSALGSKTSNSIGDGDFSDNQEYLRLQEENAMCPHEDKTFKKNFRRFLK